jgi:hypothetical protein
MTKHDNLEHMHINIQIEVCTTYSDLQTGGFDGNPDRSYRPNRLVTK